MSNSDTTQDPLQEIITTDATVPLDNASRSASTVDEAVSSGLFTPADVSMGEDILREDLGEAGAGVQAIAGLAETVQKATQAIAKFNRSLKRPRRSRQCRGKRARNYVRTLARSGRNLEADERGPSIQRLLNEARSTGALAEHRRLSKARAGVARKRGRAA